jgi:hypothetical protein
MFPRADRKCTLTFADQFRAKLRGFNLCDLRENALEFELSFLESAIQLSQCTPEIVATTLRLSRRMIICLYHQTRRTYKTELQWKMQYQKPGSGPPIL